MSAEWGKVLEFAIRVGASLSLMLLGALLLARGASGAIRFAKALPVVSGQGHGGSHYVALVLFSFPGIAVLVFGAAAFWLFRP